jgi:hypothetical protein
MQKFALPALVLVAGCFLTSRPRAFGPVVQPPAARPAGLFDAGSW